MEGLCLALLADAGRRGEEPCLALGDKGVTHKSSGNHEKVCTAILWGEGCFAISHFLEHKRVGRLQKTKSWGNP